MKNTKRVLAFLVGAAMMLPMVSAESANEYEATAQGFGGPVTVKITVDGGKVTATTITGEKETPAIGGAAIKTLTEKLIGVSSADEVDAVASATVTSNAVKTALADCLRQAAGEEKTETALVDGVYTGEGRGFNLTQKVQVTVEIKDGKIVSVTVGDNGETMGMIAAVEEKWIPRVVENQSLAVECTRRFRKSTRQKNIMLISWSSAWVRPARRRRWQRRNPARTCWPSTRLASGAARV